MALDPQALSIIMQVSLGFPTPPEEWDVIAEGIVGGLKEGTVSIVTSGTAGTAGGANGIGAATAGPNAFAASLAVFSLGILPPSVGAPSPLQIQWFKAVGSVSLYILGALEITAPPDPKQTTAVALGTGVVLPSGFKVKGSVVTDKIIEAYEAKDLSSPMKEDLAGAIGQAVEVMMLLATSAVPIVISGGAPATPNAPGVGLIEGTLS